MTPKRHDKLSQPASPGAIFCECGLPKTQVRPGRHGLICLECRRKDAIASENERKSNDTANNLTVFSPTPVPYITGYAVMQ